MISHEQLNIKNRVELDFSNADKILKRRRKESSDYLIGALERE